MLTFAEGEDALQKFIEQLAPDTNMNEAQTRFHIINHILPDCLGWATEHDIEVEKYEEGSFTDYELGNPRLAVLEAKREGITFEIPAGLGENLKVDIKSLIKASDEFGKAVKQARNYCGNRGIPIAIISNGHQYIAFIASRQDGVSITDGHALVFKSLSHMKDNFFIAWQQLSASGIKERNIFRYLTSHQTGIPKKLSTDLMSYPKVRYASQTQATLRDLSELFLQDVIEESEIEEKFFNECYCESGALSQYALLSKNILEARYAALFDDAETQPCISPVREKKNDNFTPDILSEAVARRPIVLLGDVGVGKTSFVKNLMYDSAYEEFSRAIYIYIDLGSTAALSLDLRTFILNEIERQLFDKHQIDVYKTGFVKGVYAADIHRFSNSIWGEKEKTEPSLYETKLLEHLEEFMSEKDQHLQKCIKSYSRSSKRQIIISLDNADQRNFDIQQKAFIIAQELAKNWAATVFISVRPQTFFKSKRSGALTAYPHKIFTISPPRIDAVINKRLKFALRMARGSIPIETMKYVRVNAESLTLFLKSLINSLAQSGSLCEFLANITGGNIRNAIEFVTVFIGSPNVDAERIIERMSTDGDYRIRLHEFVITALLGDYSHYTPDASLAMNVFDVTTSDKNEHFLVPFLISFLCTDNDLRNKDGFFSSELIFNELQDLGFNDLQINSALRRSTNKKLIETSQRITFEEDENGGLIGDMPASFRITSIGAYHLKRWMGEFSYLDSMAVDTPIFSKEVRHSLLEYLESFAREKRFIRATIFRDYLIGIWNTIPCKPQYFDFHQIIEYGSKSFEKATPKPPYKAKASDTLL